ncbi:hypothetical protein QTP88_028542 [Uroleucon formosanum]
MLFNNSFIRAHQDSMVESDKDYIMEINNDIKPELKKQKVYMTKKYEKWNKNVIKTKAKKNNLYLDRIGLLMKNAKVDNDLINSITVKQPDSKNIIMIHERLFTRVCRRSLFDVGAVVVQGTVYHRQIDSRSGRLYILFL